MGFVITKEVSITFFTLVLLISTCYHIKKTKQATEQKSNR
jgi:hypothetical protein